MQSAMRLATFRSLLAAAALLGAAGQAGAVILYFNLGGARSVALRVGSNNALVNVVNFNVTNAALAPGGTPVTGVAGGGASPTTPAGGIYIEVTTNRRGQTPDVVRLNATALTGLTCTSGTCLAAGTVIPFSTISWTSYEPFFGAPFTAGIPSGSFLGVAPTNQNLFSHTIPPGANDSLLAANVLIFSYSNATLYPSGIYTGRVTYTVTVP